MKKYILSATIALISLNINAQEVTSFLNIKRNSTSSISAHLGYTDSNWTGTMFWNKIGDVRLRAIDSELHFGSNGRLGIGTAKPLHLLQIHAADDPTLAIGLLNEETKGKSTLAFYASQGGFGNKFSLRYYKNNTTDRFAFVDGGNVEVLSLNNGGNIGIGTANTKGYKLAVAGKVVAEEMKVALQGSWPDYVFENNYELPHLEEVEHYIKENKHLKNIPSAQEVEKNGIFVGEMHSKLLRKIEELTLYTIQQEKKIQKLEEENKEIKILNKEFLKLQLRLKKLESQK